MQPRNGARMPSSLQPLCQEAMKVVSARFALDAEAAGAVRAAVQPALHLLAYADVLGLHLLRHRNAVGDELLRLGALRVREVEVKQHPAAIRAQGQDEVRV